ncbi:MAG: hypothetical protein JSW52_10625 [Candidatus Coatesbacteria bacterium]|nr:MAG: hypothetical protein JSW52_10625 [Candidatus Coatesbacteria bacterium]
MENDIITCPKCGSPLAPITYQEGLYSCEFCGEVEEDGEGFVVNGKLYPTNAAENDEFPEENDWDTDDDIKKELTLGDVFGGVDLDDDGLSTQFDQETGRDVSEPSAEIDLELIPDDFEIDDDGALHGNY